MSDDRSLSAPSKPELRQALARFSKAGLYDHFLTSIELAGRGIGHFVFLRQEQRDIGDRNTLLEDEAHPLDIFGKVLEMGPPGVLGMEVNRRIKGPPGMPVSSGESREPVPDNHIHTGQKLHIRANLQVL